MKIKRLLKDRRGFTIMEAVIAIALLLIVTGAFLTTCIVAAFVAEYAHAIAVAACHFY